MLRGLSSENTPSSRSRALLVSVTCCDHCLVLLLGILKSPPNYAPNLPGFLRGHPPLICIKRRAIRECLPEFRQGDAASACWAWACLPGKSEIKIASGRQLSG